MRTQSRNVVARAAILPDHASLLNVGVHAAAAAIAIVVDVVRYPRPQEVPSLSQILVLLFS